MGTKGLNPSKHITAVLRQKTGEAIFACTAPPGGSSDRTGTLTRTLRPFPTVTSITCGLKSQPCKYDTEFILVPSPKHKGLIKI